MTLDGETMDELGVVNEWPSLVWGSFVRERVKYIGKAAREAERMRVKVATDAEYRERRRAQKRECERRRRRRAA